ncbi:MAG TPA: MFS transporter [Candidatus Acidoferrales bacterium]|nr:MFS transporter [Candidatus Acidoferrales bacterium]
MKNRVDIEPLEAPAKIRAWSSLLYRDFRLVWGSGVLAALAVQVRNVTGIYQVYQLTGSPFQLGLTGFLQALPFVVFGLFAGAVADVFDRKKLLLATIFLQLVPSLTLGLLTATGAIQVWHIYVFTLLGAFVEVFNWPARSALIPRLVPQTILMNAVTLNTMIIQTSFLLGPAIGGVLIDRTGLASTYFWSAAMIVPALFAIPAVRRSGEPEGVRRMVNLRSIVEGVEFIWIQRIILSLFLLDFGVTLFGFYRPILPIFAADVFKTGASGLGALYAAPSAGSLIGSVALLMMGDIRRKGIAVVVAAILFGASLALLGLAQWFWLAVAIVIFLGIADSVSVAIRRTVVQLLAPDEMLGRASSLITVFAQATNGLGALLAGAAAQAIGVTNALLIGSGLCFVMIFATCCAIPQLWRYRS